MSDLAQTLSFRAGYPGLLSPRARGPLPRVKRALDVVGAVAGLVLLSPLLAVVALAIRLDSAGPCLFRQRRVGLRGAAFTMYKFRTMTCESRADVHRDYVARYITGEDADLRNADGAYKLEGDPRITRLGRRLRATSLDELPQLLNVVKGEMSLVGPRPALPYEVELYAPRHRQRLEGVPGMTGLWQVSGRNETTFEEMVDLDIAYIAAWSLRLDLRIVAKTFGVVAARGGA